MKKPNLKIFFALMVIFIAVGSISIVFSADNKAPGAETSNINQTIIQSAIKGVKAYRDVDYQDKSYKGFSNAELFSTEFRKSEITGKAKVRLTEAQTKKLIRKIAEISLGKMEIKNNKATIEFLIKETGTQSGRPFSNTYITTVSLVKEGNVWLISGIKIK